MGSRRKRSKKNTGRATLTYHDKIWLDGTVDELLSYLDSQVAFVDPVTEIRRCKDFNKVDQELAQHLNHFHRAGETSSKQFRTYSARAVHAKLSRLFAERKSSEITDEDWTVIYGQGTSCLDWTGISERKARIARRAAKIKHELRLNLLCSPRKTRASSQANDSVQSGPRSNLRASSHISGPVNRVSEVRVPRSRPTKQGRAIDDISHSGTESVKTENGGNIVIKFEDVAQKPPALPTTEHDEIKRFTPSLENSLEISESESEPYSTPLRGFSISGCGNDLSFEEPASIVELKERLHATQRKLQMVRRDSKLDIAFWKAKYCTAQDERLRLRKAKDILAAELNVLRSSSNSEFTSDRFVEREAFFDNLLDLRNSRQRIQDSKSNADTEPDSETVSIVSKLMRRIEEGLRAAFSGIRLSPVTKLQTLSRDHLLVSLVDQAFGLEWDSPGTIRLLERWREKPELAQYGLLALCGAALAHWVFQQSQADTLFDGYQDIGTRSSTNRYREAIHLVWQSDPALARTVDLMVHKSLVEEGCFKHFQRAKGKNLARKFHEALAPLCELDLDTEEHSDDESEIDGDTIGFLGGVFSSAIEVQSRLILTGMRFECAWHKHGALFDHTRMRAYGRGEGFSTVETPTIKLTLLPGIDQVTVGRVGVDFGGFAERHHVDHEQAKCLVRAVVLRDSADLP